MENFICNRYGERLHIVNTENIKICLHFFISAEYLQKIDVVIFQGSVVTCLR